MPGKYSHIQEHEKEILELQDQGMTLRQIGENLEFSYKATRECVTRYNRKQRKLAAGILPKLRGIFHSTRSIRYPTPIWVCIYWGAAGSFSIFLRKVAMNTRREAMSFSQLLPQICWVI